MRGVGGVGIVVRETSWSWEREMGEWWLWIVDGGRLGVGVRCVAKLFFVGVFPLWESA